MKEKVNSEIRRGKKKNKPERERERESGYYKDKAKISTSLCVTKESSKLDRNVVEEINGSGTLFFVLFVFFFLLKRERITTQQRESFYFSGEILSVVAVKKKKWNRKTFQTLKKAS